MSEISPTQEYWSGVENGCVVGCEKQRGCPIIRDSLQRNCEGIGYEIDWARSRVRDGYVEQSLFTGLNGVIVSLSLCKRNINETGEYMHIAKSVRASITLVIALVGVRPS
jgi:hypothetical protein